jgi:hypothetical protein
MRSPGLQRLANVAAIAFCPHLQIKCDQRLFQTHLYGLALQLHPFIKGFRLPDHNQTISHILSLVAYFLVVVAVARKKYYLVVWLPFQLNA